MPGVGKDSVIVDVAAVAVALTTPPVVPPRVVELPPPEPGAQVLVPAKIGPLPGHAPHDSTRCALGHKNDPEAKFCASCGLPMSAQAPPPVSPVTRPKPASQLSPAELAERERQHAEALAAAQAFESQEPVYALAQGESVLIHFVDDGFTFAGVVWHRGQEIQIGPGHPRWPEVISWIMLNKYEQIERYGKQFFDHGPWPGRRSYTDGQTSFERLYSGRDAQGNLTGAFRGPDEAALRAADEAERRRNRAVPMPSFDLRG